MARTRRQVGCAGAEPATGGLCWSGAGDRWAVLERSWCFDAAGSAEYESIPSDRSDEFKARFRHSRDEAVRLALDVVVPKARAKWDAQLARRSDA